MICPICSFFNTKIEQNIYDDRYGYPGRFEVIRCQNCNHASLQCDFSPEQLLVLYSKHYPRSSFTLDQHTPHQELGGFMSWLNGAGLYAFRWVPRNVRVLDIGCGFGETLGYHAARGCDVYGVETDVNIQRVADKFGYKVHLGLFDPDLYEPAFFDYVTMDQVIEHVTDPLATLQGISRILRTGGTAILSTPNANGWGAKIFGKNWINWHAPYHIQFFSSKSMQLAAEGAGLTLKKIKTITSSEWLLFQWIHLCTCPQIGVPSAFWDTRKKQRLHIKLLIKTLSLIHKSKINHCITRLFDALGIGDNYVFILNKP